MKISTSKSTMKGNQENQHQQQYKDKNCEDQHQQEYKQRRGRQQRDNKDNK